MLSDYIAAAMDRAAFEVLSDGSHYGSIPGFDGVWASGSTEDECRIELREVLEDWLVVGLRLGHDLPVIQGLDLNAKHVAVAMPYELIELTTANVVGSYATQDEALRDVAETIRLYGPDAVATLALGLDDYPNSVGYAIADGVELAALATGRASPDRTNAHGLAADQKAKRRRR